MSGPLGLACLLVLAAAFLAPGGAWAQKKSTSVAEATDLPDPAVELAGLLDEEPERWFAALEKLRAEPERARDLLVLAIEQGLESPNGWRIFHHMIEFGQAEDIPVLLRRLETAKTPLERKALRGAARSLYPAANQGEDLALAVQEFSFVQTGPPVALNGGKAGSVSLSRYVFQVYHRESLPVRVIRRLLPLRGRAFASEERLMHAMAGRLGKKNWKEYRDKLLEPVQPQPKMHVLEGLLRFQLRNPLQRPLMVRVAFNVWFARFEAEPEAKLVFLEPGATSRIDFPARVVKNQSRASVRVDMRMWEVNGPFIPIFQKLYVTF